MTTPQLIGLIAIGVIAITALAVIVPKVVLRSMRGPLEARIAARYAQGEIRMKDLAANNFGQESRGKLQLRGNGGLVLTGDCLHFFMFAPQSELSIPLHTITDLSTVKSHLGKATLFDLLKVRFEADGKSDSVAWFVADPKGWIGRISELRAGGAELLR